MSFVKLHESITDSTIWDADPVVRIVWIALLLKADRNGNFQGTVDSLARWANVTAEDMRRALDYLMSPDPQSTTSDDDGRRVVSIGQNLWGIVNYLKYRELRDQDEEREKARERKRKSRSVTQCHTLSRDVTECHDIADAEAEAEAEEEPSRARDGALECVSIPPEFAAFWSAYPKKVGKRDALKAWKQTAKERPPTGDVVARVLALAGSDQWTKDGGQYVPNPSTWLRRGGWDDEIPAKTTARVTSAGQHTGEYPWHKDDVAKYGRGATMHPRWAAYLDAMDGKPGPWKRFEQWLEETNAEAVAVAGTVDSLAGGA